MTGPAFDRRRFLKGTAGAIPVALAGCLRNEDEETYADWIPAREGFTVARLDLAVADDTDGSGALVPTLLPARDAIPTGEGGSPSAGRFAVDVATDDPLLAFPVRASSSVLTFASLGVGVSGLYELVDGTAEQPAREMLVLDRTIVLRGQFDTDYVDDRLRSDGPLSRLKVEHQAVGELNEYTLYDITDAERESGTGERTVAVAEETILLSDGRETVERIIETKTGERETASERFDTAEWLLDTIEAGNIVVGQFGDATLDAYSFGESSVLDRFESSDDVLATLSLDQDDGTATAEVAVAAEEFDDERRDILESALGQEGTERSTAGEADRLAVSATYNDDILETTQVVEENPPDESDFESERLDEENRVVADVSFNDPEEGLAKVAFTDETDVESDTIRVKSVVGEAETELSGSWTSGFVRVLVDPDGDQVVVSIVRENATEVVHRETYEPSE
ncbi:hypothetical protein [Halovenus salina]|uniref:hypothetical protein n=1 Tax=Halovenus salina TaxID=1510225 RepID=UPI002260B67E|nr:hypothetical protein [Halovenus salina]